MNGITVREVTAPILKASTNMTTAASNPATKHSLPQLAANWNAHARYFTAITFNQIVLSKADKEVGRKHIDFYFELFKEILDERKESEADDTAKVDNGKEDGSLRKTMAKGREGWRARAMENLNYTKATGKGKKKEQPRQWRKAPSRRLSRPVWRASIEPCLLRELLMKGG